MVWCASLIHASNPYGTEGSIRMSLTVDELMAEVTRLSPEAQRDMFLRLLVRDIVGHDPRMVAHIRQLIAAASNLATEEDATAMGWDDLFAAADEFQVATVYGDLAYQHDHYLYGQPRKDVQ